ncbi:MAG: hypothetical protein IAE81_22695 [Caldilineaceae bacterium]|jgi:hypothetical protein|nr:hypothetical protein [Caldilineaceae bacterium]
MRTSTNRPFGPLQWGIIALTIVTALIHIGLGLSFLDAGGLIFVLNGAGYLGLVALLYLDIPALAPYRTIIRWTMIAYTATTVIAWLFIGAGSPFAGPVRMGTQNIIAYTDKVVEITLIVLLWLDGQRA